MLSCVDVFAQRDAKKKNPIESLSHVTNPPSKERKIPGETNTQRERERERERERMNE